MDALALLLRKVFSLMRWALWPRGCQFHVLGFVAAWLSVRCVGLCGRVAVSSMRWALWPRGCQFDALHGLCGRVVVFGFVVA